MGRLSKNKRFVFYALVVVFLLFIITLLSMVIIDAVRDDKSMGKRIEKLAGWVDGSTDVSRQSSRQMDDGVAGFKGDEEGVSSNYGRIELVEALDDALLQVEVAIETKDGRLLHDVLSSELKQVFDLESVIDGLNIAPRLDLYMKGDFEMIDERHASQLVVGRDGDGREYGYRVIMRLEETQWRLFGTTKM